MKSVRAGLIYTGNSVLLNKYLNFDGGTIQGFSDEAKGEVRAEFETLTPALIDAHSHIGLVRAGETLGRTGGQ